ncbi:MAG: hypothetical protein Q9167_005031 [Letrouitia subvulpina]
MKAFIFCVFAVTTFTIAIAGPLSSRSVNCNGRKYALTVNNWNEINADKSMKGFWDGGTDAEGVKWPGASSYDDLKQFTTLLGTKLQNKPTWNRSGLPFETSCDAEPCTAIALASVINLHKWISTLYEGINIGQEDASNYAFNIATDFVKPKDKPSVWFKDLFAGIAAAAASAYSQALVNFADQARQGLEVANNQILNSADDTTP